MAGSLIDAREFLEPPTIRDAVEARKTIVRMIEESKIRAPDQLPELRRIYRCLTFLQAIQMMQQEPAA
jgi:hypothetical protein